MAKIDRYNGNVRAFAADSLGTERTVFGATTQSDTLDGNITADFLRGWGVVSVNENPTKQDFAGLGYTLGQLLAYLHQAGVAEWNDDQEYFLGSQANIAGVVYTSLVDSNIGNAPASSPSEWAAPALHGVISFTTVGVTTWAVPIAMQLGIIKPKITIVGAGGGANTGSRGACGAGGGGAYVFPDLFGVTSVDITVGAGGVGISSNGTAGGGSTSSFGAFASATGGGPGAGGSGGEGGIGTGGDVNFKGGWGSDANGDTGLGGSSILGGGGRSGSTGGGAGGIYGGGAGGTTTGNLASNGAQGIVIVEF
jgi:hypothetical protein